MKIGIVGDSFVEKKYLIDTTNYKTWYYLLRDLYGHDVEVYGESSSSIMFSANLIEQYGDQYDLIIWALTIPGRFSFYSHKDDRNYHYTNISAQYTGTDLDIANKVSAMKEYLKYLFNTQDENLMGRAMVNYLCEKWKNIMVIPCFPFPLQKEYDLYKIFNLYGVASMEVDHYFPGKEMSDINKSYRDIRPGHLTELNHKILAELVNENLKPGIFQTDFDNFVTPITPFEEAFTKL